MCLQSAKYENAFNLFSKAEVAFKTFRERSGERIQAGLGDSGLPPAVVFTHLDFNFGNYYMALKDHLMAAEYYFRVVVHSPFAFSSQKRSTKTCKEVTLRFNSISCYAHAWSNLAVIFLLLSSFEKSKSKDEFA